MGDTTDENQKPEGEEGLFRDVKYYVSGQLSEEVNL